MDTAIAEIDYIDIIPTKPYFKLTVPVLANLLAKGLTQHAIARLFKKSPQAINQYIDRHKEELEVLLDPLDSLLSKKLKHMADRIVNTVDDATIKASGLRDRAVSAGIFIDKSRLVSGESTANILSVSITAEELKALKFQSAGDARRIAFDVQDSEG